MSEEQMIIAIMILMVAVSLPLEWGLEKLCRLLRKRQRADLHLYPHSLPFMEKALLPSVTEELSRGKSA